MNKENLSVEVLEDQLKHEMILGEKFRLFILAIILSVLFTISSIVYLMYQEELETILKSKVINTHVSIDGFMATFGAPVSSQNDCQNAVDAALEINQILKEKCEQKKIPNTQIRIGIHAGEAVTGNVGTSIRKQYSITGNVVILASRLEQLNKKYDSSILISKEVYDRIDKTKIEIHEHGPAKVKGRQNPIEVFQLG